MDEERLMAAATKAGRRQRGPAEGGVPERAGAATREAILSGAERLFAELGYDGASMRQIALAAGVPLALMTYHFGTKEGIYRAIFALRSPTIVDQRIAALQVAESEADPERRLELVIKALSIPMLLLRRSEKNAYFSRILSRVASDPNPRNREIYAEFFDPVAHRVIDAIRDALPDRTLEEAHWAYHILVGAMGYIMADSGRISRLSDGRCDPEDEMATAAYLVTFIKAALLHGRVMLR